VENKGWALVTGASSGIGEAMALQLAERGYNLVLVARRQERLQQVAGLLQQTGREAIALPIDLAQDDGPSRLFKAVKERKIEIDMLINNAGFGDFQPFREMSWEQISKLTQVNWVAVVQLTYLFLPQLLSRPHRAYLLNVSSQAAFQPVPNFAVYAAVKTAVRDFSEAISIELKRTNLHVCCLCPGATESEFTKVARMDVPRMSRAAQISAERCARIALNGMFRRRRLVISGSITRLSALLTRFAPRGWAAEVAGRVTGRSTR